MKKTFEVGQRVGVFADPNSDKWTTKPKYTSGYDEGPTYGKIVEIDGDKARVLFKESWLNEVNVTYDEKTGQEKSRESKPALVPLSVLFSESDAKSLDSVLEKEFKAVEKQVQARLKVAAQNIREANKLAKKLGTNLGGMGAGYGDLYDAMDSAGWNTSSFGC